MSNICAKPYENWTRIFRNITARVTNQQTNKPSSQQTRLITIPVPPSGDKNNARDISMTKWHNCIQQKGSSSPPCHRGVPYTSHSTAFLAVASIQIYFEGGEIFSLTGRGTKFEGPKPEARSRDRGWSSRGGCSEPPPHQRGRIEIWCNLGPQNSLQKCLITSNLLQKGYDIEGTKRPYISPRYFLLGGGAIAPSLPRIDATDFYVVKI